MSDRGVSNITDENELFKNDRASRWLNRPRPAKPTRQQHHKPKSGKGKTTVIRGDGDPCPRCRVPMEIHEHNSVGDKQLRQRIPMHIVEAIYGNADRSPFLGAGRRSA